MLSVVRLSVGYAQYLRCVLYTECHYAECRYGVSVVAPPLTASSSTAPTTELTCTPRQVLHVINQLIIEMSMDWVNAKMHLTMFSMTKHKFQPREVCSVSLRHFRQHSSRSFSGSKNWFLGSG